MHVGIIIDEVCVVVATGDRSSYFPPNSIVICRTNLLGVTKLMRRYTGLSAMSVRVLWPLLLPTKESLHLTSSAAMLVYTKTLTV